MCLCYNETRGESMEKLTNKQKETLQTLKKFIAKHGYPPTVRELCKELDLNSPATIHFHLKKLAENENDPEKKFANYAISRLSFIRVSISDI